MSMFTVMRPLAHEGDQATKVAERGKAVEALRVLFRSGDVPPAPALVRAGAYTSVGSTAHFTVSYDNSITNGPSLAKAVLDRCEADYAQLVSWFGGITPGNLPFTIYIDPGTFGAYHASCDATELHLAAFDGNNGDLLNMLNVAEADEVMMAAQNKGWDCGASNGEGLSRVLATERYPAQLDGFASANSWLNGGRPDWVTTTEPTDRNYVSIGCATLYINYLRFQLGHSLDKIVQAGGSTLQETYQTLTGSTDAFRPFFDLLDQYFPQGQPVNLPNDNPFPLAPITVQSKVAPAEACSGNTTAAMAVGTDGRIFYNWWELGQGPQGWREMPGGGRTDVAPAAGLVNTDNHYLFALVKALDGNLYLNQGELGRTFVGWQPLGMQTNLAPAAASSGNTTAAVAVGTDGHIFYNWWELGQGPQGWREMSGDGRTDMVPAAALVNADHHYLFALVKGLDGNLYVNQGELGRTFVGWQSLGLQTNLAPAAASSGNTTAAVAVGTDGRIFYNWWELGQGPQGWLEMPGEGRTDVAPAVALVNADHHYMFAVIKGLDGYLYVNQGELGRPFVGWQRI
jgi:hypothetical protein